MSTIRTDAEQAGAQAPAEAPKLRRFRVLCAVTRSEWYAIDAADEDTARREAFSEGELVETGDTTNVTECDIEEVQS